MNKEYYVYIMTNNHHNVLYTGVTGNLEKRVEEHVTKKGSLFCKKYNICKLVYAEVFNDAYEAICREKQLKAGSRKAKIKAIESLNPNWKDLLIR